MPRNDFTDITFILDRSGSMAAIRAATIEGFNGFVAEQRQVPGDGCWTLVQFDTPREGEKFPQTVFAQKAQNEVPPLTSETFVPRDGTALVDAVCLTIDAIGRRLAATPEHLRPSKVLVVIMTDGLENSSRRFTRHDLNDRIAHQRDKYRWGFIFLGANQDAIATAAHYAIPKQSAMTFEANAAGTRGVLRRASKGTRNWKAEGNQSAVDLLTPATPDVEADETDKTDP